MNWSPSIALDSRVQDYQRRRMDLRSDTYESAGSRSERETVFLRAVELLDPVITRVLSAFNDLMLASSGTIEGPVHDHSEGIEVRWLLSWPEQRRVKHRIEKSSGVDPITVRAHFGDGWTHGHLAGSVSGDWPMQVTSEADAERQWVIIWTIAEAELHYKIWASYHPWDVVPLPTGDQPPAAKWG